MTSDFLTGLSNQLGDQYGLDNQNRSIDIIADGTSERYGQLGDFANQFDQSEQRAYLQEGYLRYGQYNAEPKQLEVLFQEPDITVLVKKRAFCSLSDNYQLDHMSDDEKLFYKATKILFANKCKQIAAFERLSKIQRVSANAGYVSDQIIPVILGLVSDASISLGSILSPEPTVGLGSDPTGGGLTKLAAILNQVQNIYAFSGDSFYTKWLTNSTDLFQGLYAQGTGVMEFCNVSRVTTKTSVDFEGGSFDFTISDPYNLMLISSYDIERALNDATNPIYDSTAYQLANTSVKQQIATNTQQLNALRAARGASAIQFITNPQSLTGLTVTAIFTGSGQQVNFTYSSAFGLAGIVPGLGGVTISTDSLVGGPLVGNDGISNGPVTATVDPATGVAINSLFPSSESSLFGTVVQSIYTQLQLQSSAVTNVAQNSVLTNYTRRKLRLHYAGKLCIQPMDQIHIYMGSKSQLDNKILGGLQNMFTGNGALQNLMNTGANFASSFNSLLSPSANIDLTEKAVFVGADFPNWLWSIMRNVFVTETAGAHVFGGLVTSSDSSYREGSYTASISGKDMTHYLEKGVVNFKPAIDVFNGPLYDPLTPFKTSFDTVSSDASANQLELLDENKEILASNSIRFKQGPYAGQIATEAMHANSDNENQNLGNAKQVFYSPDGLVHKWKEGIGTFTRFSNAYQIYGDSTQSNPSITQDPFAGQDVMNAISLSITGQPYNYATFYKGVTASGNGPGRDPQTGLDGSNSFYASLTRDLVKNNTLWGNFIPFKSLYMDEATYQTMITGQASILNSNDQVNTQLSQIQKLTSQLQFLIKANPNNAQATSIVSDLTTQLQTAQAALQNQLTSIQNQLKNNQGPQGLNIIGNDVSFDYDSFLNDDSSNNQSLNTPSIRKSLRQKVNFLTRRMSWQVRSNEDKNLFIVDDSYDKDYDIQAFEKSLVDGLSSFDSEFTTVIEKIKAASGLLNLEVFCDPQGHIRCRPPYYNKMPSSVFYNMFQQQQTTGVQLYPNFLSNLCVTQLQSLQSSLEVIEDQIRLSASVLGAATDAAVANIINGSSTADLSFTFLTDESTGNLSSFNSLYTEANPDVKISSINNSIESQLNTQAGINQIFGATQRSQFIVTNVVNPTLANKAVSTQIAQTRFDTIQARLQIKTGQQINIDQFETTNSAEIIPGIPNTGNTPQVPDVFKITNDIANYISQRQNFVKQLSSALNNAEEVASFDAANAPSTSISIPLFPAFTPVSSIPQVFANMIEDESYDDLGPGSGSRYVIEDYQIIDFNIRESPAQHTMVEVQGRLDLLVPEAVQNSGGSLGAFGTGGGNSQFAAAAVDYDMWRMYGFGSVSSVSAPFLSDPQSQLAPYAATILSRYRKEILGGTLTIAGNEYQQPGDVIYFKSRDLLFYVHSVNHNFTYGSSFQTTMEISYGHTAGDYIPTTLDVIGKLLYNNRDSASYINRRQGSSYNQQNVGVFALNIGNTTDPETLLFGGTFGSQNAKTLNNIFYTANYAVSSNQGTASAVTPMVELRIYYNSNQGSIDTTVLSAAQMVKQILTGNYEFQNQSPVTITTQGFDPSTIADPSASAVDAAGKTEFRSPSQKAVDMARNIYSTNSVLSNSTVPGAQFNSALYGYIIDVWITFNNSASTTSTT